MTSAKTRTVTIVLIVTIAKSGWAGRVDRLLVGIALEWVMMTHARGARHTSQQTRSEATMPWYKFSADHGPGHQSHNEEIIWFSNPLKKSEKEEQWELWCDPLWRGHVIGDVTCARLTKAQARKLWGEYTEKMRVLTARVNEFGRIVRKLESCFLTR